MRVCPSFLKRRAEQQQVASESMEGAPCSTFTMAAMCQSKGVPSPVRTRTCGTENTMRAQLSSTGATSSSACAPGEERR